MRRPASRRREGNVRGHLGFDEPRRHGVDADAAFIEQRRPGLGQTDQPGLARRVIGLPAIAGDAADRSQQNHPAVVVQGAAVEQRLGQHLWGIEVDREHGVPEFRGHVGQGFIAGDAGVVHHDVDAVGQLFDQLCGGVFGADVQGDAAPAEACGEGFEIGFGRGHVEQDHVGAVTGQGFGNRCTDAACRAGDQRLAPRQRTRPVRHRVAQAFR